VLPATITVDPQWRDQNHSPTRRECSRRCCLICRNVSRISEDDHVRHGGEADYIEATTPGRCLSMDQDFSRHQFKLGRDKILSSHKYQRAALRQPAVNRGGSSGIGNGMVLTNLTVDGADGTASTYGATASRSYCTAGKCGRAGLSEPVPAT